MTNCHHQDVTHRPIPFLNIFNISLIIVSSLIIGIVYLCFARKAKRKVSEEIKNESLNFSYC